MPFMSGPEIAEKLHRQRTECLLLKEATKKMA
jgi:hypothetical protein